MQLPWEDVKREMVDSGLTDDVASLIGTYIKQKGGKELIKKLESDTRLMSIEDAKTAVEEMKILFQYCIAFGIENKVNILKVL